MTIVKWFPWQLSFPSVRDFLSPFIMLSLSLHVAHLYHINIAPITLSCRDRFNLHLCLTYSDLCLSLFFFFSVCWNFPLRDLNFQRAQDIPNSSPQHLTGPDTEAATPRLQRQRNLFPLLEQQKSLSIEILNWIQFPCVRTGSASTCNDIARVCSELLSVYSTCHQGDAFVSRGMELLP
jgi:hypothetical protein